MNQSLCNTAKVVHKGEFVVLKTCQMRNENQCINIELNKLGKE